MECDETSIQAQSAPSSTLAEKNLLRSFDSGVVLSNSIGRPAISAFTVVIKDVLNPAALKIESVRNTVVVLPFVPVMPHNLKSPDGLP